MKPKYLLLALAVLSVGILKTEAQTHLIPTAGNTIINGTGFTLKDPGGDNNIPANCNGSVTIFPSVAGKKVRVTFTTLNIGSGGLAFYNGTTVNGSIIANINSYDQSLYSDIVSTDVMGCVTILFNSSLASPLHGFAATVDEVSPYPAPALSTVFTLNTLAPYLSSQLLNYTLKVSDLPNEGPLFNFNVQIVLSTDSFLNTGDTVLKNVVYNGSLQAGLFSSETGTVQLPGNTVPGNYYLLAITDYITTNGQLSGNPVTKAIPLTIGQGFQDVAVSNLVSTLGYHDTLLIGFSVNGSMQIADSGNLNISSTNVCIYLSSDSILNPNAFAIDTFPVTNLLAMQSAINYYATNIIPAGFTPGNYYLIAKGDFQNLINNGNEHNNISVIKVTLVEPYIDLGVQLTNALPDTLYGGLSNNIGLTLLDLSLNPITKYGSVDLYISSNPVLDSTDIMIYSQLTATDGSQLLNPSVNLPDYLTGGNFYLIAKIDEQYYYDDINPANNISVQAVNVVPLNLDLQVTSAMAIPNPVITDPGVATNMTVNGVLRNNGKSSVTGTSVGIYFSTDTILSSDDTYLGAAYVASVPHQSGVPFNTYYLQMPADTSRHYLLFVANPGDLLTEYDYANNTLAVPFEVVFKQYDIDLVRATPDPVHAFVLEQGARVETYYTNLKPNPGTAAIRAYLSTDTTVGGIFTGNMDPYYSSYNFVQGQIDSTALYFNVPTVAPGNYYLILWADSAHTLNDVNLANNRLAMPITIDSAKNDIFFSSVSITNSGNIAVGTPVTFSGAVTDTGVTNSVVNITTKVSVYASMDTVLGTGDIFMGSSVIASSLGYQYFNIPVTLPNSTLGYKYILFLCDSGDVVNETNYGNNVRWMPVTIGEPAYDLYPTNATLLVNNPVAYNATFSFSCSINDTGNAATPYFYYNVYISTDSVYQAGDQVLAQNYVSSIAPGSHQSFTNYVYGGVAPGNYFLLFYADALNQVQETNENNNVIHVPITISPPQYDIQLLTFTAGAIQFPLNTPISNYVLLHNEYSLEVDSFYVNLYLSADTLYHAGDVMVGSLQYVYPLGPVDGYSNSSANITATIPSSTAPGNYYLVAYADATQTYNETNWQNNFGWAPIQVVDSAFDMYPVTTDTVYTCYAGNYVTIPNFDVCNFGLSPSNACNMTLYLSDTTVINSNSTLLATTALNPLQPMTYVNTGFYGYWTFPQVAGGNYYMILTVDSQYKADETNPNNNVQIWNVTVPPPYVDIALGHGTLADTLYTRGFADVGNNGYMTYNLGTEASTTFTNQLLLSRHPVPDSTAVILSTVGGYYIQAKDSENFYPNGTIPGNTVPGNYYIIPFANITYAGPDHDSANNYKAYPVVIEHGFVDLTIDSAWAPDTLQPYLTQTIGCRVRNIGPLPASPIYAYDVPVTVYLSTDSVYSVNDNELSNTNFNYLAGNSSLTVSTSLSNLGNLAPGNYYLFFYVNNNNSVTESNDSNNIYRIEVYLNPPQVDLGISGFTISKQSVIRGVTENLNAEITDYTQGLTGKTCYAKFYVSPDSIVNGSATLLDSFLVSYISYYNGVPGSFAYTIPNLSLGHYYFICTVDEKNLNNDPNRLNNRWAFPFDVIPTDIDLVPVSITIPNGYVDANYTGCTFKVGNNGNSATPSFLCSAYLSTDSILSTNDYLVMTYNLSISGNSTTSFYSGLYNANAPAGVYYLIFVVNSNDSVIETNYNNNTMVSLVSYYNNTATYLFPDSTYTEYYNCNASINFDGGAAYNPASQTDVFTLNYLDPTVTGLSFTSFALTGNSNLKIYNGASVDSALIGSYTGSNSPGNIVAANRALTLRLTAGANAGSFSAYYNCTTLPPPAHTDLYFNSASISVDTLIGGSFFDSYLSIYDSGLYNINNCSIDYVLSANPTNTGATYDFGTDYVTLGANSATQHNDQLAITPGLADGPYYMLIILNESESVAETNYNNNTAVIPVIYKNPTGIEQVNTGKPFDYRVDEPAKTIHIICNNNIPYDGRLYDDLGRQLQQQANVKGNTAFQVLTDGVYFIELMQQGILYRYKAVVY